MTEDPLEDVTQSEPHYNLCFHLFHQALVEFFQRVIEHQANNKMTLNNVSVIMAPNIFMFKGFRSKITEQQEYSMAAGTANIMRLLIRYQDLLWTVRITMTLYSGHQMDGRIDVVANWLKAQN